MATNFDLQAAYDTALEVIDCWELAPETRSMYEKVWDKFEHWCSSHGLDALPASVDTVALYLLHIVGATKADDGQIVLGRRWTCATGALKAIRWQHRRQLLPDPTVHGEITAMVDVLERAAQPDARTERLVTVDMVEECHRHPTESPTWCRDLLIVDLTFFGALYRYEVVALEVEGLTFTPEGVIVASHRRHGRTGTRTTQVAIAARDHSDVCPVRQLRLYLTETGITKGWLFPAPRHPDRHLSVETYDAAVKRVVEAGLGDAAGISSLSLRHGFIASVGHAGGSILDVARKARTADIASLLHQMQAAGPGVAVSAIVRALGEL
jgi:integrase